MPKTPELDSACVGATSASAAANAAAASATANAAAATTHTYSRTFSSAHMVCTWYARGVHVVCSGLSAPCSEPAASLQRGADTGFEDIASIGGIMKVSGAIGSAEHLA